MNTEKKYGKPQLSFKIDIVYSKYESLLRGFKKSEMKEMLYLYFDTDLLPEKAKLLKADARLRARIRGGRYSIELKFRHGNQFEDYYQPITLLELGLILQGLVPIGHIRSKLLSLALLDKMFLIGTAQTSRVKKFYEKGILVLDKTTNADQTYFQIEYRSEQNISPNKIESIKDELGIYGDDSNNKLKRVWQAR